MREMWCHATVELQLGSINVLVYVVILFYSFLKHFEGHPDSYFG